MSPPAGVRASSRGPDLEYDPDVSGTDAESGHRSALTSRLFPLRFGVSNEWDAAGWALLQLAIFSLCPESALSRAAIAGAEWVAIPVVSFESSLWTLARLLSAPLLQEIPLPFPGVEDGSGAGLADEGASARMLPAKQLAAAKARRRSIRVRDVLALSAISLSTPALHYAGAFIRSSARPCEGRVLKIRTGYHAVM
jgi:hypothetical protein